MGAERDAGTRRRLVAQPGGKALGLPHERARHEQFAKPARERMLGGHRPQESLRANGHRHEPPPLEPHRHECGTVGLRNESPVPHDAPHHPRNARRHRPRQRLRAIDVDPRLYFAGQAPA